MFYATGDVSIFSVLVPADVMTAASNALQIPPFTVDKSGRWEDTEVYTSRCLGLEFMFCVVRLATADREESEYGLSIFTTAGFHYDGTEREIDAAPYCAFLMRSDPRLRASADTASDGKSN